MFLIVFLTIFFLSAVWAVSTCFPFVYWYRLLCVQSAVQLLHYYLNFSFFFSILDVHLIIYELIFLGKILPLLSIL